MFRIEIFGNKAIEEDLFDRFKKNNVCSHYSLIPVVYGVGNSGPRMGDHIWPEENFMVVVYCEDEEAEIIKKSVDEVKEYFKKEGLKIFISKIIS